MREYLISVVHILLFLYLHTTLLYIREEEEEKIYIILTDFPSAAFQPIPCRPALFENANPPFFSLLYNNTDTVPQLYNSI